MPKPIRLTRRRAEALLAAAGRGCDEWEAFITDSLDTADLDEMRELKAMDLVRAAALDAMAIVRHRYAGGKEPASPNDTLF